MPAPVDPFDGRGRQHGPLRPDWGVGWAELRCDRCSASWVGPDGEPCDWCARSRERMIEHQAELLLRPPDRERADITHPSALSAWTERLARGVAAGIVDERRARNALEKEHG